jgi:hypothetical protein
VTWLAFFALACQLVLAFGHVHAGKNYALAWNVAADTGSASVTLPSPHQGPSGLADDFCAICASISLANTLVIPTSPVVAPPKSFVQDLSWSFAAVELASIDHLLFNARAPPHA